MFTSSLQGRDRDRDNRDRDNQSTAAPSNKLAMMSLPHDVDKDMVSFALRIYHFLISSLQITMAMAAEGFLPMDVRVIHRGNFARLQCCIANFIENCCLKMETNKGKGMDGLLLFVSVIGIDSVLRFKHRIWS